jgi:hypothetical protein
MVPAPAQKVNAKLTLLALALLWHRFWHKGANAMAMNDIGTQQGTRGSSMSLNTQRGCGSHKPDENGGKHSPGGTRPPEDGRYDAPMAVPMPSRGKRD